MIFDGFWVPIVGLVCINLKTFSCSGPPIVGFGSQGWLFGDLWCKSCQDLMPECVENIVNSYVFIRFTFPQFSWLWHANGGLGTSFWRVLRDLGCLIGLLAMLCCGLLKSMISRHHPESHIRHDWRVICPVWRPYTSSPQTADQQPAISNQLIC